jgi:15-cis-phytoene synthase
LGAVLATGREPMVTRIRLAWWREALERLDREKAPAEPVLQALAAHVLPTISGIELAAMEEGWAQLVGEGPLDPGALRDYAARRGGLLFTYSARLLGHPAPVETAGARWALVDLARRSSAAGEAQAALSAAQSLEEPGTWPPELRPLGMLSVLTRRDLKRAGSLERHGSPARMLRMLRHRLTGR